MTPLTAEKIAELEIQISEALDYSRNFAAAKPNIGRTEREHIEGLCDLLERSFVELICLAKRVAGAPVAYMHDVMKDGDSPLISAAMEAGYYNGKRVALVEIVGGEEG